MVRITVATTWFMLLLAPWAKSQGPVVATPSVSKPTQVAQTRQQLGLASAYPATKAIGTVKVAVLDSGFAGVESRPYLPTNTVTVEHYDVEWVRRLNLGDPAYQKPFTPNDPHGRLMAQLVWATTGSSPEGPQFYLLNANGPTLFRRAVKYAIEAKVDVILFAGTFEGAGNYDGRGPINSIVDEATNAGIIWVNAAGNSGQMVYDGPLLLNANGYVVMGESTSLKILNRLDEQTATITLTWNDYRDTEDAGTFKDLDLIVEDAQGRTVGSSELRQVPPGVMAGEGQTTNPRERLTLTDLATTPTNGEYRIRVKYKSGTLKSTDRIRILVAPVRTTMIADSKTNKPVPIMEFIGATGAREVYPPADHAGVIAVGDFSKSSATGPTADGRVKPDVLLNVSTAKFSNGEESEGSSNAAAYFAGIMVTLKATEPTLTTSQIRSWVRQLDSVPGTRASFASSSPNQNRAMKIAIATVESQKAQGVEDPGVWVSGPAGSYRVRTGGVIESLSGATTTLTPTTGIHAPWRTPSPAELRTLTRSK